MENYDKLKSPTLAKTIRRFQKKKIFILLAVFVTAFLLSNIFLVKLVKADYFTDTTGETNITKDENFYNSVYTTLNSASSSLSFGFIPKYPNILNFGLYLAKNGTNVNINCCLSEKNSANGDTSCLTNIVTYSVTNLSFTWVPLKENSLTSFYRFTSNNTGLDTTKMYYAKCFWSGTNSVLGRGAYLSDFQPLGFYFSSLSGATTTDRQVGIYINYLDSETGTFCEDCVNNCFCSGTSGATTSTSTIISDTFLDDNDISTIKSVSGIVGDKNYTIYYFPFLLFIYIFIILIVCLSVIYIFKIIRKK